MRSTRECSVGFRSRISRVAIERRSVAHVGALYLGRNLSQVLAAMRAMARDRPESVAALNLDIAGPMDERHRAELNADLAAGGLTNSVTIHGVTPRAKALEILNGSRLALVLAQNQKMCVPAKLYECMGLGVPTLVIAEGDSAAANEARRIGAMTVDNDDVAGIRAVLEDVLAGRIPPKVVSAAPISYRDLAVGMDQLLREEAGDQRHTTQRAATAGST